MPSTGCIGTDLFTQKICWVKAFEKVSNHGTLGAAPAKTPKLPLITPYIRKLFMQSPTCHRNSHVLTFTVAFQGCIIGFTWFSPVHSRLNHHLPQTWMLLNVFSKLIWPFLCPGKVLPWARLVHIYICSCCFFPAAVVNAATVMIII